MKTVSFKKRNLLTATMVVCLGLSSFAQLKVFQNGSISMGSLTAPPSSFSLQATGNTLFALNSGEMFINTTTDYGSLLNIYGADKPLIYCNAHHTSDWQQAIITKLDRANGVTYVVNQGGTDNFFVQGSGLANSRVGFYTFSDRSLKENITPVTNALEKVLKLKGVTYNYIKQKSTDSKETSVEAPREMGLIAQDVESVVPEVVRTMKDGKKALAYQHLVSLLIEAIKEQQSQIEDLKNQITNQTDAKSNSLDKAVLYQNTPNPFTEKTEIKFNLPASVGQASLFIYNMNGTQLKEIQITERGNASVTIEGSLLEAGMYLYALIADKKEVATKKMILTK